MVKRRIKRRATNGRPYRGCLTKEDAKNEKRAIRIQAFLLKMVSSIMRSMACMQAV